MEKVLKIREIGTGLGIAAPQIGINKRIIVVGPKKENIKYKDAEEISVTAMINPKWKEIKIKCKDMAMNINKDIQIKN